VSFLSTKELRADVFVRFLTLRSGRWAFEESRFLMSEGPLSGLGAYGRAALRSGRPGTCSGTGTAYHPTALPTVAPYGLPVPGLVPEAPAAAAHSANFSGLRLRFRFRVDGSGFRDDNLGFGV
jgi:hypothetical protein